MSPALSASQQLPISQQQDSAPEWKRQLAERLDAYRSKRPDAVLPPLLTSSRIADSRASKIARSVASRYAAAPTYSELLIAAAQAQQAAAEAHAALAARVAEDARIEEEKIVEEQFAAAEPVIVDHVQPGTPVMPHFAERTREMHLHQPALEAEPTLDDLLASSLVEPRSFLPSKLIEFPRELVSAHRAKLRTPNVPGSANFGIANFTEPEMSQLRIFEVQPDAAAVAADGPVIDAPRDEAAALKPANGAPQNPVQAANQNSLSASARYGEGIAGALRSAPSGSTVSGLARETGPSSARAYKGLEWASISLDKEPGISRRRKIESSVAENVPFLADPASIDRRLMAFAVDFAAVTAGFLCFLTVFVASTAQLPTGMTALALAGAAYASLWLLYQMLFFSLSGATAGMLYARIALCTFDDRNPTRSAMRRRLAAWWLSCLPLGMGCLWCFVDEDNLSWHDRMTRIYQRSY